MALITDFINLYEGCNLCCVMFILNLLKFKQNMFDLQLFLLIHYNTTKL